MVPTQRQSSNAECVRNLRYFAVAFLAVYLSNNICHNFFTGADAKEVEATNEWTLLGENDTVAAGVHVRMNLETGEKWVKLAETTESNETPHHRAQVTSDGLVLVPDTNNEGQTDGDDDEGGIPLVRMRNDQDPHYDFDMMHRTLSQLPQEEKERIELPELPAGVTTTKSLDDETRQVFETKMKQIWEKRQEQLRMFEKEYVADLPKILKDRIESIRDYLRDPPKQWANMIDEEDGEAENDSDLSNIVAVLQDLEYHLSDIDMARDFHTLGGWPLLVSLVSDVVHRTVYQTTTNATSTRDENWTDKVSRIQAHAAWALGTLVKNTEEFAPYALEEIRLVNHVQLVDEQGTEGETISWTPLDLLLRQLSLPTETDSKAVVEKRHKILYALGALLRGNRPAQVRFGAVGGPAQLSQLLVWALERQQSEQMENKNDRHRGSSSVVRMSQKLSKRLLSLASDIVKDVELHGTPTTPQVDDALVRSFESWCELAVQACVVTGDWAVQETALKTLLALTPHCKWQGDGMTVTAAEQTLLEVKKAWDVNKLSNEMDADVFMELQSLLDSVIQKMGTVDTAET